ncbi:hypothetical protein [Tropicimonas sp. S265A]|uniref:hypothetical protein n=1 Tax=Tropicimonas sp. S265A TaxID=3415134 RepID=UPI003C7A869C
MWRMRCGHLGLLGLLALPSTLVHANTSGADRSRADDTTFYVSGFAGQLTENVHHEVLLTPWDVEFLDSFLLGAAVGVERPSPWAQVDLGAELQLVKWTGNQHHWELNAIPIIGRYRFDGRAGPLRSLAFGVGFSYASAIPTEEVIRDGESNRFLIYWKAEAEFGPPDAAVSPFIKLHHRSNAFGLIEEEAGSNTVAVGLRRRF